MEASYGQNVCRPALCASTWMTGDVTPHRRAFTSRNCVISGAKPCELVQNCANPSRVRGELA
eukprot:7290002-Prymnesium_polylepis.1